MGTQLAVKDLGPCQVLLNGVDLGPTKDGVTFKEEQTFADIYEDGHGKTPVDATTTGKLTGVECNFTRCTLAQMAAMIESATAGGTNLKVVNSVGNQMFASSQELILKPLVDNVASVTATEWLHIHRAYPLGAPELKYDNQNQRVIKVVFKVFPDDLSTQVGEIWRMGPAS